MTDTEPALEPQPARTVPDVVGLKPRRRRFAAEGTVVRGATVLRHDLGRG